MADTAVEDATAWTFFSVVFEYIAAVTPAPVAALRAAIIANVVFDIVEAFWGNRRIECVYCRAKGEVTRRAEGIGG